MDKHCSLLIVKRLEDLGKAKILLSQILKDETFEDLRKHNNYWDSEHEKEADKLDDIRLKIQGIEYQLYDLLEILNYDFESED